MFDYHVHSTFSADSKLTMTEACQRAVKLGLHEIAFTEHIDFFYPNCELIWEFDYAQYAQKIEAMRQKYSGQLSVIKGIEVGLHPLAYKPSQEFTTSNQFDFAIGSVHIVGDLDMHNGEYFAGKSVSEAIETYFQMVDTCVQNYRDFNVLGHLDLIKRYLHHLNCKVNEVDWKQYDEYIVEILKHLVETGRGIEINTSGFHNGLNCTHPDLRVLHLYRELGGEIITVGSDAHCRERVGGQLDLAVEMIESAGFRYLTTFRERQPRFVPIGEVIQLCSR